MSGRREKAKTQIIFGVVLLLVAGVAYWYNNRMSSVTNFTECAEAGNPIMESYPRQCKTQDGQMFKEDIGNELEKDDLVRVSEPRPNTTVTSPLTVKGMARGNWFFEATFPVVVVDWDEKIIGEGYATAEKDPATGGVNWMTTEFVPFTATVEFGTGRFQGNYSGRGVLILKKSNASGLPEHNDALEIPVRF